MISLSFFGRCFAAIRLLFEAVEDRLQAVRKVKIVFVREAAK